MENSSEIIFRGNMFGRLADSRTADIRKKYNLERTETEVLYFLAKYETCSNSADICRYLGANKRRISRTAENLCRRGFLMSYRDDFDRRYVHYVLTDSAKGVAEMIKIIYERLDAELFAGLSEEETENFTRLSEKIVVNMEKLKKSRGEKYENINFEQAKKLIDSTDCVILDVREEFEYAEGHAKGAVLLPVDSINAETASAAADKDAVILVYCRSGNRSRIASELLYDLGYTHIYNIGSLTNWPYKLEYGID